MVKKIGEPPEPKGLTRWLFRLPIGLYQAGLGWLLGGRFIKITHIGRKSGKPHQVVVEVMRHDQASDTYYVASGWGEKSDWYLNVMKNPRVNIQVGRRKTQAVAERVPPEVGEKEMLHYSLLHPGALKSLARFMGYEYGGTQAEARELGRQVPIVAFHVVQPQAK